MNWQRFRTLYNAIPSVASLTPAQVANAFNTVNRRGPVVVDVLRFIAMLGIAPSRQFFTALRTSASTDVLVDEVYYYMRAHGMDLGSPSFRTLVDSLALSDSDKTAIHALSANRQSLAEENGLPFILPEQVIRLREFIAGGG